MMKLLCSTLALTATLAAAALPAFASVTTFTIENKTGITLTTLYLAASKDEKWGENILKGDHLKDGESQPIEVDDSYYKDECEFDIKLWDVDHNAYVFSKVDLCKYPSINITLEDGKPFWHSN
ncbi:MAG: hypothetical protein JWM80_1194 [Cyanobacteria bacterium RYN_339]|nr:hypothetical protein [Cyanobacteria bacterium RYN_339]